MLQSRTQKHFCQISLKSLCLLFLCSLAELQLSQVVHLQGKTFLTKRKGKLLSFPSPDTHSKLGRIVTVVVFVSHYTYGFCLCVLEVEESILSLGV